MLSEDKKYNKIMSDNGLSKKRNEMREKIKNILSNSYTKQGEFDEDKALNELCVLLDVSKRQRSYTSKEIWAKLGKWDK